MVGLQRGTDPDDLVRLRHLRTDRIGALCQHRVDRAHAVRPVSVLQTEASLFERDVEQPFPCSTSSA